MPSQWNKSTIALQIYFSDRRSVFAKFKFLRGTDINTRNSVISRCGSVPFLARWLEIPPEELTCFVQTGTSDDQCGHHYTWWVTSGFGAWGFPLCPDRMSTTLYRPSLTVQCVRHSVLSDSSCFSFVPAWCSCVALVVKPTFTKLLSLTWLYWTATVTWHSAETLQSPNPRDHTWTATGTVSDIGSLRKVGHSRLPRSKGRPLKNAVIPSQRSYIWHTAMISLEYEQSKNILHTSILFVWFVVRSYRPFILRW